MTIAFVFPGQGSQSIGMLADLASDNAQVGEVFTEAADVLGYDLWNIVQNGPAERLNDTVVTQPAMLAAGVAIWRTWLSTGGAEPALMAGHSLGEYSALVCAGSLSFSSAMELVKQRSQLMADAVPAGDGAMAAVLGMEDEAVIQVCAAVSGTGVCEAVNFNSPGQVVIAGHREAVEQAVAEAKEQGARRAIVLPVSVPSHSSLMQGAGKELAGHLDKTEFAVPTIPVVSSINAEIYRDAEQIRRQLSEQVFRPVRWVETINAMTARGASRFVECGPGKVLTGLTRRIDRSLSGICVESPATLAKAQE
ncbi:MAG: ACP S-malonyltransferase [Gammaproteobacteria bacterium]|nr:ACP S-malonyltransferase [Gammaproteobacteria bacterium]